MFRPKLGLVQAAIQRFGKTAETILATKVVILVMLMLETTNLQCVEMVNLVLEIDAALL